MYHIKINEKKTFGSLLLKLLTFLRIYILYVAYCSYCMSRKCWPDLYSNLLRKMAQDFLDIHYISDISTTVWFLCTFVFLYFKKISIKPYFFFRLCQFFFSFIDISNLIRPKISEYKKICFFVNIEFLFLIFATA